MSDDSLRIGRRGGAEGVSFERELGSMQCLLIWDRSTIGLRTGAGCRCFGMAKSIAGLGFDLLLSCVILGKNKKLGGYGYRLFGCLPAPYFAPSTDSLRYAKLISLKLEPLAIASLCALIENRADHP